jgi:molybdenum cofactor synthesis domain-containing protein
MTRTAAALVIGNEILTGKIQESNVAFLAKELFALGVRLRRVVVCPDEVSVIAADLTALREAHDVVFTSGGVGPTHDDVTIEAVAQALDREVVRSAELERLVRGYFGARTTEEHLRMADVPAGAELIRSGEMPWPTVAVENVYVFPGVPEIFRAKFPVIRDRLRTDAPFVSRAVYAHADEFELAPLLDAVAAAHPAVAIGSYLRWGKADYRVKLTIDGSDRSAVDQAVEALLAGLPPDQLHSVE